MARSANTNPGFRSNAEEVGLPPLLARRSDVYTYYRLEFLPDGYPGRRTASGLQPHPLYGTYVISDYMAQYVKSGEEQFLVAARRVADAAIARMEPIEDAIAFWYEPDTHISSLPARFYSALTQARYLQVLTKLATHTPEDQYRESARAIFRSLRVPVDRGGVMREHRPGVVIEEYPHQFPDYTLNGWTTAMLLVWKYAKAMGEPDAMAFFGENMAALRDVIHLYDMPRLASSRYRLVGPAAIRLTFEAPGAQLLGGQVVMPGRGNYSIDLRDTGKWHNRVRTGIEEDGTVTRPSVLAQVYLSVLTFPRPNSVEFTLETTRPLDVRVEIGQGTYRPEANYLVARSYSEIASTRIPAGVSDVKAKVPWAKAELVAYPTNFGKTLGGKTYNQYHFIHVENLEKLHEITGDAALRYWARVWRAYPTRWPSIPEYAAADIALVQYQPAADGGVI